MIDDAKTHPAYAMGFQAGRKIAADEIERQAAELRSLREALRDVVEWADDLQIYAEPEHHMHPVFYKARAALKGKE